MKKLILLLALLIGFLWLPGSLNAQIDIKGKIKNQTNNRANNKADQGIDKGLDVVENGVKNVFRKKDANAKPTEAGDTQESEQKNQKEEKVAKTGNTQTEQQSLQSYSKFDFVPGEKVMFYDDFSQDAVGDFPALWNTNGSAEVVTTNLFPGNWMRFNGVGAVWTDALLKLPDNYTIEFDVIPIKGEEEGMAGYDFRMIKSINAKAYDHGAIPGKGGFLYHIEYYGAPHYQAYTNDDGGQELGLDGMKDEENLYQKINQKYHISIWVQKSRLRLYMNETKLFDLPKAFPVTTIKMDRIRFEEGAVMVSNIRIAVGNPDMRNKLMTEGKLVSYGIYFDVNKANVKPESYGTLKEIASILNEVPDVKVKIIGFTDSDGADAANLELSKQRAAAVKEELVRSFGVKGDRLVTDGMGEGQPIAPNDSPSNKALNRRVEFIKL